MDTIVDEKNMIDKLRERLLGVWESTPDEFPLSGKCYSDAERDMNEALMKTFITDTVRHIRGFTGKEDEDSVEWGSTLKKLIFDCGTSVIGLDENDMKLLLNGGFCDVTSEFITKAREFDAVFKLDDMLQSLRNVWIMNCIQRLMGSKIFLTPSVFAYSMLYPYTDNYLDAKNISEEKKYIMNERFGRRLRGESVKPEAPLENRLFRLVEMVEGQFDRMRYPMVFMSLLGIHDAQVRSMQQDGAISLSRADILDISAEKGGASVLADGCLIRGGLSPEEAVFIFGFGILLQLIDDLQDVDVDRSNRHKTLFSIKNGRLMMQSDTNRLINFTIRLMDDDKCFADVEAVQIKELIKKSITILILGAVACNSSMYDMDYLARLEKYSPLGFRCLRDCYKKIGREYGKFRIKLSVKSLEVPMARAFASGIIP